MAVLPAATPVDTALPFIATIVALVAWCSSAALFAAVPLLLAGLVAFPDERLRLQWYGAVLATTFVMAICRGGVRAVANGVGSKVESDPRPSLEPQPHPVSTFDLTPFAPIAPFLLAFAAIALLRWIPLGDVLWIRELVVMAIALAIVAALRATPIAIAAGVIVALVTPAVPLRSFGFPLAALLAVMLLRALGFPRIELRLLPALIVAVPLFFFAWSGVVARGFPLLLRSWQPPAQRQHVDVPPLGPTRAAELVVPHGAHALIVSGANVPRRRPPAVLGRIEPGGATITIGDVADWGYMRREQWYRSRNTLPRRSAGIIRGYGYSAWVDGAGRLTLPEGTQVISVIADPAIPPDAALQIEGFEMEPR